MPGFAVTGQVGAQTAADGARVEMRLGRLAEQISSNLQAAYSEACFRGQVFSAANPVAQAISVALSTAYTGLALYNPIGSGKILVPLKVKFAHSVAPAAIATIGLISTVQTAAPTGTTELIARSNQIGNQSTSSAKAYSVATIATPVWHQQLRDGFTAANLPAPTAVEDLDGSIILLPGGLLAIGALTAVTGLASMSWMELPYAA